jgi:LPPG:FO 2-phospho-L-lactate transferase
MQELGIQPSVTNVAAHYRGLIDGLVIDTIDDVHVADIQAMGIATNVTGTVMRSIEDRKTLAQSCLTFLKTVGSGIR